MRLHHCCIERELAVIAFTIFCRCQCTSENDVAVAQLIAGHVSLQLTPGDACVQSGTFQMAG